MRCVYVCMCVCVLSLSRLPCFDFRFLSVEPLLVLESELARSFFLNRLEDTVRETARLASFCWSAHSSSAVIGVCVCVLFVSGFRLCRI